MPPAGKWIAHLKAETPVAEAATLALSDRLGPLPRLLKRVAARSEGADASTRIHQLRVATRRATAAMNVFADLVEPDQAARLARSLRRLRRAAGAVRDQEILHARFTELAETGPAPERRAAALLAKQAAAGRSDALPRLLARIEKLSDGRLERRIRKVTGSVNASAVAETSACALARRILRGEVQAVRTGAGADLGVIENVHELRIAIKGLRYAAEVFAACFGDRLKRSVYPDLMKLQEHLGAFNDSATVAAAAAEAAGRDDASAGLRRLAARLADRLADQHREFLEFWRGFDGEAFLRRAESMLSAEAVATGVVEPKPVARRRKAGHGAGAPGLNGHAPRSGAGSRRVAAIDVGTNSLRLIVAEAAPEGAYRVLDDEKEVTRLGRGLHETGRLDPASIEHSVAAIARMKAIAEGYGAGQIRVVGTAAAREASNGRDLARAIAERTGLSLEVISAEQEAMLAYRSASRAFDLRGISAAVIDVGGGSTEIVLSMGGSGRAGAAEGETGAEAGHPVIERIYTIPLGAVRLTERFGGAEACGSRCFDEMRRFVKRIVKQHIGRPPAIPQLVVGTGGTLTTLGAMTLQRGLGVSDAALFSGLVQGHDVPRADLRHMLEHLRKLPVRERARVPGLSADRADIIVAGLVIVDAVLKRLAANRVRVHEGGIRDGLLLTMVGADTHQAPAAERRQVDPVASAKRFARSCAYEEAHSLHVAHLALQLFDQLEARLEPVLASAAIPPARGRQVLEAAAVLHDVGYLINYAAHHKHSYHLIVHADLPGWTSREIRLIANIARYHRCAEPKSRHAAFATLGPADQQVVCALAGILRIADGLDRTHTQRIRSVGLVIESDAATFRAVSDEEPGVDLWGAERKSRLFERTLGLIPHFEWRRGEPDKIRAGAAREGAKGEDGEAGGEAVFTVRRGVQVL